MLNKKVLLRIALNSLLGAILIFAWSRFVNLNEVGETLRTVDLRYGILFFLLFISSGFVRAARLRLLLKGHKIALKDLTMLHYLSQFLSFLIPIRAGEIAKSVYLTTQTGSPLSKTVVWVFVDRFLDFWVAVLLIGSLLPFVKTTLPGGFTNIVFIALALFTLAFVIALKSEDLIKKIASFLSNFLVVNSIKKWFVTFTHSIAEGFEVLRRSPLELGIMIGLTVFATLIDSLVWIVSFAAFHIKLEPLTAIWADALTALTFLIPAAPGYVGSAEAAGAAVFSGILGLPINITSAALVFFHILTLLAILLLGITSLYVLKFDLSSVWKKLKGKD